jgi:hypothetical protein
VVWLKAKFLLFAISVLFVTCRIIDKRSDVVCETLFVDGCLGQFFVSDIKTVSVSGVPFGELGALATLGVGNFLHEQCPFLKQSSRRLRKIPSVISRKPHFFRSMY